MSLLLTFSGESVGLLLPIIGVGGTDTAPISCLLCPSHCANRLVSRDFKSRRHVLNQRIYKCVETGLDDLMPEASSDMKSELNTHHLATGLTTPVEDPRIVRMWKVA